MLGPLGEEMLGVVKRKMREAKVEIGMGFRDMG